MGRYWWSWTHLLLLLWSFPKVSNSSSLVSCQRKLIWWRDPTWPYCQIASKPRKLSLETVMAGGDDTVWMAGCFICEVAQGIRPHLQLKIYFLPTEFQIKNFNHGRNQNQCIWHLLNGCKTCCHHFCPTRLFLKWIRNKWEFNFVLYFCGRKRCHWHRTVCCTFHAKWLD